LDWIYQDYRLQNKLAQCDLIYSAGLYDYLDDKVAKKLSATLFDALKPGGRLVLTNFLKDTHDIGWGEAMMDWFLIYRDQADIERSICRRYSKSPNRASAQLPVPNSVNRVRRSS
jgi:extracellular factor (EF) 3-hydroxypalmitic acid methyl ester biosynthesis protein